MKLVVTVIFCSVVVGAFLVGTFFLSHTVKSSEHPKSSPFECGFFPLSGFNVPFSVSFFVVSLMFLLFDVEILLVCLLPLVSSFFMFSSFFMWAVLFVILFSTLYEWLKGILSWVY